MDGPIIGQVIDGPGMVNGGKAPSDCGSNSGAQRIPYTIPGILHFIQHEWAKFEMERSQWEVERAELQARISFLQGERKGQENLKRDLVRRIKMLEYALKQERTKYNKLKYGTDGSISDIVKHEKEEQDDMFDGPAYIDPPVVSNGGTWRQGRQLLRQYLQEIGYTDTIIDVRSRRVRTLLGLTGGNKNETGGGEDVFNENQLKNEQYRTKGSQRANENALRDTEQSVMDTFDFLKGESGAMDDDDDDDLDEDEAEMKMHDTVIEVDEDTEEALAEFDFLSGGESSAKNGTGDDETVNYSQQLASKLEQYKSERKSRKPNIQARVKGSNLQSMMAALGGDEEDKMPQSKTTNDNVASRGHTVSSNIEDSSDYQSMLSLGELADLSVSNEADETDDVSGAMTTDGSGTYRKAWAAKYTLRSHFDAIRALAFHPTEPVLITASEDETLKLWNLLKTVQGKKAASLDVEPVYTFRGHEGPVLSLCVDSSGERAYSGGRDSVVHCWRVPSLNSDPYDAYVTSVLGAPLVGHTDSVWAVQCTSDGQLLSCSADGTVRLWDVSDTGSLLRTFTADTDDGVPTSVDCVTSRDGGSQSAQFVTSYSGGGCKVFDVETGQCVVTFAAEGEGQANKVKCHPTMPLTITAQENHNIHFYDNTSGQLVHSMVAHLDAVTSLSIDPHGLYLMSGSHDASVRVWNLDSRTCVQEITAHRKKHDESIHDVAFHPSRPYVASAGADGLSKVFV